MLTTISSATSDILNSFFGKKGSRKTVSIEDVNLLMEKAYLQGAYDCTKQETLKRYVIELFETPRDM